MGAPLAAVANVLKVVVKGFIDGLQKEVWANVLHFAFSGTSPTNSTCSEIGHQIASGWFSHMASVQPSPTTFQQATVTDLTAPTAGEGVWNQVVTGTRGDDSIPANAALLISYPTQFRYKGGHPRQYLYVLGNADLTGAEAWTAAATAEVLQHWHDFLLGAASISVAGTTLTGFVSVRYHGKFLPNTGAPHFYLVNPIVLPINLATMIADQQIASQRRRIGREEGGAPEILKSRRISLPQALTTP